MVLIATVIFATVVVIFGTCGAAIWLRLRGFERGLAVAQLPVLQRFAIWQSVWWGKAVRDPVLAAPAIELAQHLDVVEGAREGHSTGVWWRWPFAAFFAVVGANGLVRGAWFVGAMALTFAGYFAFGITYTYQHAARKRAACVAANQLT